MKELCRIFFGKKGLSAASAEYFCSLVREVYRLDETRLTEMSFVTKKVYSYGVDCTIHVGDTDDDARMIEERLERCIRFKRLLSWLREALKERERYVKYVKDEITDREIADRMGIKMVTMPERQPEISEDEWVAKLPLEKRTKIYCLQTRAAAFGRAVSEKGYFTKAREELIKALIYPDQPKPTAYSSSQVVEKQRPSAKPETVDEAYFRIQQIRREAQTEYNSYMHQILKDLEMENYRRVTAYEAALSDYRIAKQINQTKISTWRKTEVRHTLDLKIIIPEYLRPVYLELCELLHREPQC